MPGKKTQGMLEWEEDSALYDGREGFHNQKHLTSMFPASPIHKPAVVIMDDHGFSTDDEGITAAYESFVLGGINTTNPDFKPEPNTDIAGVSMDYVSNIPKLTIEAIPDDLQNMEPPFRVPNPMISFGAHPAAPAKALPAPTGYKESKYSEQFGSPLSEDSVSLTVDDSSWKHGLANKLADMVKGKGPVYKDK